jgi:hypothetical protein
VTDAPPQLAALLEHLDTEPRWLERDRVGRGAPLSQNAQFSTISLSFLITQHFKLMGYWPSDSEVLDHMHFWRYPGYLMGVEP